MAAYVRAAQATQVNLGTDPITNELKKKGKKKQGRPWAPCFRSSVACSLNSASPTFSEMLFTIGFPWHHFSPARRAPLTSAEQHQRQTVPSK